MVKKLLKHEFIYYFRTFSIFLPIILVFGIVARLFRVFDNGSTISDIAIFSSSAMLVVSCIALGVCTGVLYIVRFYKNIYSAEGYLTLTLPVTNAQHIFVKLLTAVACEAICILAIAVSVCIAFWSETFIKFFQNIPMYINEFITLCGAANVIGYAAELILMLVIALVYEILLCYACITVGQTAKKNRILAAVGAYFVYYVATQIVSTVFTVVVSILGISDSLVAVIEWIGNNIYTVGHIYFCGAIVLYGGMAAIFWLVTQRIMTHKLNLE